MIQSVNNKTIKDLVKLKNKKTRDEKGLFLVDGFHMVEEAKKAGVSIDKVMPWPFNKRRQAGPERTVCE